MQKNIIDKMEINLILHKKYLHDIYIRYIYLAILFVFFNDGLLTQIR